MITDADVGRAVDSILRERLGSQGYQAAVVSSETDYEGEPIIRVTARFARAIEDTELLLGSVDAIRHVLIEKGDDRFVFLNQEYPGSDEEVNEDEDEAASYGAPQ